MSVGRSIRRSFLRGLAALLPTLLTLIVLVLGISFLHTYFGKYVNIGIKYVIHWTTGLEMQWIDAWYNARFLGVLGVVVAILGVMAIAYFVGTFIGNRMARFFEAWMTRMPILRRIYPGAKQVTEFFFAEKQVEFRRVVAIEYPRRGIWSVGFVTGRSLKAVCDHAGQELLTVFIPSSPTPVTGYIVAVPRREVIDLPVTVDQAFEYTISGGVIVPASERLESFEIARLVAAQREADQAAEKTAEDAAEDTAEDTGDDMDEAPPAVDTAADEPPSDDDR